MIARQEKKRDRARKFWTRSLHAREFVFSRRRVRNKNRTARGRLALTILFVFLVGQPRGSSGAACSANQEMVDWKKCCGPGKYRKWGSCKNCQAGKYSDSRSTATSCKDCDAGRISSSGSSDCELCPSGKKYVEINNCEICPPRTKSVADRTNCDECQAGKYNSEEGQPFCKECDAGRYSQPFDNMCQDCPPGKYQENTGGTGCTNCLEDRFQNEEGQSACKDCVDGLKTVGEGQALCIDLNSGLLCAAGKYNQNGECQVCPSGRYAQNEGLTNCVDCPAGYYLYDAVGENPTLHDSRDDCQDCSPGMFQSQAGADICQTCSPGRYQDEAGSSICSDCGKGKYLASAGAELWQDHASADKCIVCPNGFFNDKSGRDSCFACPKGTVNNGNGNAADLHDSSQDCAFCDEGRFSDELNATGNCAICPVGFYSREKSDTRDQCDPCPTGTYMPSPEMHGQDSCAVCVGGRYAATAGSAACDECGAGSFISGVLSSNHDEQLDCLVCFPGKFSSDVAAHSCVNCPAGRYLKRDNRLNISASLHESLEACTICPKGRFNEIPGLDSDCAQCDAGTFLLDDAADALAHDDKTTDCTVCPAGKKARLPGSAICSPCEAGRFNDHGENSVATDHESCLPCARGFFTGGLDGTGQTGCTPCAAGYFSNTDAAESSALCLPCEKGFFGTDSGSMMCKGCMRGKYGNVTTATSAEDGCVDCAAGASSQIGQADHCTNCSVGKYLPIEVAGKGAECLKCDGVDYEGATTCPGCPQSTWGVEPNCQNCTAGTFSEGSQTTGCETCPAGYFSGDNAFVCVPCPAGRWSATNGAAGLNACSPCGPGKHGNNLEAATSSSNCVNCEVGKFGPLQVGTGIWNCEDCEPGRTSNVLARQTPCDGCLPGQFSMRLAATGACTPCPRGWSAKDANSSVCEMCLPGFSQASSSGTACVSCRAGRFSSVPQSWACFECPSGFYQNEEAQASCLPCVPGKLAPFRATTVCTRCEKGTFVAAVAFNESACVQCPMGWYQDVEEATACIPCIPGTTARQEASIGCQLCGIGRHSVSTGHDSECKKCTMGKYQQYQGATACMSCIPGQHQPEEEKTSCEDCGAGRFSALLGTEGLCTVCPAGFSQIEVGRASCRLCQSGFFQKNNASRECDICPAGYYAERSKSVSCAPCQTGEVTSSGGGASRCHECLPGRAGGGASLLCDACVPGQFRGARNSPSECIGCPNGFVTSSPGQTTCQKCAAGMISSGLQSMCKPCLPGRFRADEDSACLACAPGFHAEYKGSTFCLSCDTGRFAEEAAAEVCTLCAEGRFQDQKRSLSCKLCPGGLIPNEHRTACERPRWKIPSDCRSGEEFLNDTDSDWKKWTCDGCPAFAICSGHSRWKDVVPARGSKRLHHNPKFFAPCTVFSSCDWPAIIDWNSSRDETSASHGNKTIDPYDSCAVGHEPASELCSQCIPGWSKLRDNVPCEECLDTATTILVFVGVFIFIIFVFYALVTDSLEGSKDMIPRSHRDTKHATEMPFHSIAIRILSSYMQVSGMLLAFDLYVPEPVRALVSAQSSASSLGEQLLTFECLVHSRQDSTLFYMKQIFAAWILPTAAGTFIAIIWLGRHCICQHDGNDDEAHILRERIKVTPKENDEKTVKQIVVFVPSVDGFITTMVVLFYTLYPSLVNRMALTFSCVSWDKGETDVLTEALSVQCWTPAHMGLIFQVGIPGSLLYMIFIPMLISVTLRHQRKRQRLYPHQAKYEPRWTMRFSFMFAGYREGFEWWESVVMARKCLFVLTAIFLRLYGPSAQVIASAMVLCLATSMHLQYRPYFDQGLNWLESMSLQTSLAQLLTSILANVLTHGRANADGKRVSSSSSMGPIANFVVIVFFFVSSFAFFLAVLRETIRGSYETKGCVGRVARCCLSRCHKHVFGSHNVHTRNKKARRHSRRKKKGTQHLFSKFFTAVDRGVGEVKAHNVEEDHDKSLGILNERVVVKSRESHRRLEKRLATRRASMTVGASQGLGGSGGGASSSSGPKSQVIKVQPLVEGETRVI